MSQLAVTITGKCPKCGGTIVVRQRRVDDELFLACLRHPACRWTGPYDEVLSLLAARIMKQHDGRLHEIDRALRDVIRCTHPDKWPQAMQLATEITKMLNAVREKTKT